jgi:hypothetical protein
VLRWLRRHCQHLPRASYRWSCIYFLTATLTALAAMAISVTKLDETFFRITALGTGLFVGWLLGMRQRHGDLSCELPPEKNE